MRISDWSSGVCSSDLVAERDEVGRALGAHDAGEPRHRQHVALLHAAVADHAQLRRLHEHGAFGFGAPLGDLLVGDVDHHRLALGIEMREVGHAGVRSEEPTSELQSLMRTSYAVFCLTTT